MISKRTQNTGSTGSMQSVSESEVRKSETEYLEKDNKQNRSERKRLGLKFYRRYWGCLETSCGKCGTVYRFPAVNKDKEAFTEEDANNFYNKTRECGCPCCQHPIHTQMKIDAKIYFERREMIIDEQKMLKINETEALLPPDKKLDIFEE